MWRGSVSYKNFSYKHYFRTPLKCLTIFQPDLVKSFGYPLEEHFVTTDDGYILTLHRIHFKKNTSEASPVVLLGHCLMSSSASFTWGPTDNSIAYMLADEGKNHRQKS